MNEISCLKFANIFALYFGEASVKIKNDANVFAVPCCTSFFTRAVVPYQGLGRTNAQNKSINIFGTQMNMGEKTCNEFHVWKLVCKDLSDDIIGRPYCDSSRFRDLWDQESELKTMVPYQLLIDSTYAVCCQRNSICRKQLDFAVELNSISDRNFRRIQTLKTEHEFFHSCRIKFKILNCL